LLGLTEGLLHGLIQDVLLLLGFLDGILLGLVDGFMLGLAESLFYGILLG
jgi:hypothetical protein